MYTQEDEETILATDDPAEDEAGVTDNELPFSDDDDEEDILEDEDEYEDEDEAEDVLPVTDDPLVEDEVVE